MTLKFSLYSLLILFLVGCNLDNTRNSVGIKKINSGWEFTTDKFDPIYLDSSVKKSNQQVTWQKVSLPHTANIEPAVITGQQWQGTCWYRKNFTIPNSFKDKHVAFYFEAAMQVAEVWLNGKKMAQHYGGYLPFYVELSDELNYGEENLIVVKLNNEDNPQIPPGKSITGLDFNWFSGLYRNVYLIVKDNIHITHPTEVDIVAGGGVFVRTLKADSNEGVILVKTDISNQTNSAASINLISTVYDMEGNEVSVTTSPDKIINASEVNSVEMKLKILTPKLWSPETPNLYRVKMDVIKDGKVIDSTTERFGLRSIKFDKDGFYLNGNPYKLRGTNRHQEYPYIGYALSDNAQRRDAWKIKQAGFNFVRLSHYPQSESFMNACDELGIFVMDAIPGWQFFGDSLFQERCYRDIRQLVRRDRNHPSVILWEASLNESGMSKAYMNKSHAIVHEEFPGKEVFTCGWIDYAYDVFIPARQHAKAPDYWKTYSKDKPLFIAEYGDWEYYAHNAGFNHTAFSNLMLEERTSRQLRGDGQVRLAQQALNYQESHNDNLYNRAAGDANWLMFDYNRGYAPDIESSGIMDIFRLPKFAFHFFRSQKDLTSGDTVLFIANYWDDPTYNDVKVYSNCDEVELFLNGKLIERRQPDTGPNSTMLHHPPFTFDNVPYRTGELKAKAYYNEDLVAEVVRTTPLEPAKVKLSVDESNTPVQAGCNDVVFVYASIMDVNNNPVPLVSNEVRFKVEGSAELIGDNPVKCEAGVATILMKIGEESGVIKVSAAANNLEKDSIQLVIK